MRLCAGTWHWPRLRHELVFLTIIMTTAAYSDSQTKHSPTLEMQVMLLLFTVEATARPHKTRSRKQRTGRTDG